MVVGECIRIGNLTPKTAISSQKEPLRESNFKRYGRRRMYTHRNLIPKTVLLSQKEALRESNFKRYCRRQIYIHIGNLIPKTALLSQKEPLRESNFKRYGRRRMYTHRKFDSQNGPFEPERTFTGIKFQEVVKLLSGSKWPFWESNFLCVYILLLPYLLKFDSRKASFWLKRAVLGIKISMCIHSPSTIPLEI